MGETQGQYDIFYEGRFFEITLTNLGEFKFLFRSNPYTDDVSEGEYYMEVFCRPYNGEHTDLICTKFIDDIDLTITSLKDRDNFDAYITEFLCYCVERVFNEEDPEDVYIGVICSNFTYDEIEDIFDGEDKEITEMLLWYKKDLLERDSNEAVG